MIKKSLSVLFILLVVVSLQLAPLTDALAGETSRTEKRAKIDAKASAGLSRLFEESPKSKTLYDQAYGYAVFGNWKFSFVVTGGGGRGVAVHKVSGARTYMNMGTVGLNLGLGGQKYQVVFLFEDAQTFDTFVNKGWEAEASANAVAGNKGANAGTVFRNGMAVYQMTDGGLMLQADISGTKYWKSKLNGG